MRANDLDVRRAGNLPGTPDATSIFTVVAWAACLALLGIGLYVAPIVTALGVIAVGIGLPALWLVWQRPDLGLLVWVFLTASIISVDVIDLRLPIGGLDLRDLVFLGLLGILLLRVVMHRGTLLPWPPVSILLLAFLGVAFFSALYAFLYQGVAPNWVFSELRSLIYYSAFFIVSWSIVSRKQLNTLLIGLFILADLMVAILIVQQFLGRANPLLETMWQGNWKVWDAEGAVGGFGAVRIIPPGHVLLYMISILTLWMSVYPGRSLRLRLFGMVQFVYLNVGLLLTYTRAQWLASAVSFAIVIIFMPWAAKSRLLQAMLIALLVVLLVVAGFGMQIDQIVPQLSFLDVLSQRVLTMFTPSSTLESPSLRWRIYETAAALDSIREHPLLGVGLGNFYRSETLLYNEELGGDARFMRYIHNSYLYVAAKIGLPGLGIFLVFCLVVLVRGWAIYHMANDIFWNGMTLSILAGFVGLLLWAVFHSHFMEVESTIVIGLMLGIIERVRHFYSKSELSSPQVEQP